MNLPFLLTSNQESCIQERLKEFSTLQKGDAKQWFSELCFCILTAQSSAAKAIKIQQEVQPEGFLTYSEEELRAILKKHAHRFYNKKAAYIIKARTHANLKDTLMELYGNAIDPLKARLLIAHEVQGIGLKEASHFLRNVGFSNVAIIDRHIIRFLVRYGLIREAPKTLTPGHYFKLEDILRRFKIPLDKLDLMIWCHMTGTILK